MQSYNRLEYSVHSYVYAIHAYITFLGLMGHHSGLCKPIIHNIMLLHIYTHTKLQCTLNTKPCIRKLYAAMLSNQPSQFPFHYMASPVDAPVGTDLGWVVWLNVGRWEIGIFGGTNVGAYLVCIVALRGLAKVRLECYTALSNQYHNSCPVELCPVWMADAKNKITTLQSVHLPIPGNSATVISDGDIGPLFYTTILRNECIVIVDIHQISN